MTEETPSARHVWHDLSVLIEPGRRWRWLLLVGIGIVGAGLEAVGALLVFFATNRIAGGNSSTVFDGLFDRLGAGDSLAAVGGVMAVFFVVRGLYSIGAKWFEARTVQFTAVRTSNRLFRRYLTASYRDHLRRNSAELMRNTVSSVESVSAKFLTPVVSIAGESVVIMLLVVVLALTAPVATAVVAVVLGLVGFTLLRLVRSRMRQYGELSEAGSKGSLAVMQESLQDLRSIRIFGRERYFALLLRDERMRVAKSRYSLAMLSAVPRVGMETLVFLLLAAFLAVTSVDSAAESVGVLGLFGYAALRIMPGVNRIIGGLNLIRFGAAAVGNVVDDLEGPEPELPPRRPRERFGWSALEFEGVGFSYDAGEQLAVEQVQLVIEAGETIGVVGQTGSGKSTFIDLLLGLLEPTQGRIAVDGVAMGEVLDDWQRSIGIVSQDLYLLDDTIRRNVAFGVPVEEIDDARVRTAIRRAQLEDFVTESALGLETAAGERGVSVSGGERQRIAIARALYREPGLLVLDEATSALDTATERNVMDAIRGSGGARTVVMVAHRLSSVRLCDRIVVFDGGRIVDVGSYEELAARNEVFGELVRAAG